MFQPWSGHLLSQIMRSDEGTVQCSSVETETGGVETETGGGDSRRVGWTAAVGRSVAATLPRSSPAHWSRCLSSNNAGIADIRRQATAAQRAQQIPLKTVVDEAVDDRIHATVAASTTQLLFL